MRGRLLGWYCVQLHPPAREIDPSQFNLSMTSRMQQFLIDKDALWPLQVDENENGTDNNNDAGNKEQ